LNLQEMETRLLALEDLEKVKKLHRQYVEFIDNLEFGKALDLLSEDASIEVRNTGVWKSKVEIKDLFFNHLVKYMPSDKGARRDGHSIGEPILTIEGDKAKGTWRLYILMSRPPLNQWVQGRHDCEYLKMNGDWKISKLKITRTLASDPTLLP
jgi:hypothetical protein